MSNKHYWDTATALVSWCYYTCVHCILFRYSLHCSSLQSSQTFHLSNCLLCFRDIRCLVSPNSFNVGVLNAVLSVSALAGMLCPPPWSCLCLVSCLVSQSPNLFFNLGCCVRLSGLVSVLSPNLSPSLPACSSAWDAVSGSLVLSLSCLWSCLPVCQLVLQPGMLCPAPWSCLCLVSGLVSQSASLFFSLGCCVRLPGLVFVLSHVLSPNLPTCSSTWDAVSGSLVLSLSCLPTCLPVCQLVLQPGMLCPAPWSCLCLVSGLVSQSASLFFSLGCCVRVRGLVFLLSSVLASIWASMLCPPLWSCLSLFSGLVSQLVSHLGLDAVSAFLGLPFSCLRSCLPACLPDAVVLSCCLSACLPCGLRYRVRLLVWFCLASSSSWSGMLCHWGLRWCNFPNGGS